MASRNPTRRRYLLTAGTAATALLAGCQSSSDPDDETDPATTSASVETTTGDETAATTGEETTSEGATSARDSDDVPEDENPDDGYPPAFEDEPEPMEFDADSFPTERYRVSGTSTVEVPLVPLEVAHNLYARGEARIVDARAAAGYRVSHVLGAVRSPAPNGGSDDPTAEWPDSDPVITYCHCPTHLAVQRAAHLIDDGFEEVYALQGGYQAWKVADFPTGGEGVPSSAKSWTIEGQTDGGDAGGVASVSHKETDQVAGAEIDADGSYAVEFSFRSASASDAVTVGTPSYEVEGSLESFVGTTVNADSGTDDGGTANATTTNETDENSSALGRLVGGRFR